MSSPSSAYNVMNLSGNVVERLLDRYPFTERELRGLLRGVRRSSSGPSNATTTASSSWSSLGGLVVVAAAAAEAEGFECGGANPEGRLPEGGEEVLRLSGSEDDDANMLLSGPAVLALLPELEHLYRLALRKVFVVPSSGGDDDSIDLTELETCLEALGTLLGRRGSGGAQQFLWDALYEAFQDGCDGRSEAAEADVEPAPREDIPGAADRDALMKFLYKAALVSMAMSQPSWNKKLVPVLERGDVPVPEGWIQSLSPGNPKVSRSEWEKWTGGNNNQAYRCVSAALHGALRLRPRGTLPPPAFPPPDWFPDPLEAVALGAMGAFGSILDQDHDPASLLLYDSDKDGLSFRVWQQALLGFCGPTLLIVRTTNEDCWGYRTSVPWKSSRTWYTASQDDDDSSPGSLEDSCYLFRLSPKWNQYKMVGSSSSSSPSSSFASSPRRRRSPYHQYLNVEACHQPQNRALKGLAVGGVAPDAPRLYVTDALEQCRCSPVDQLFEPGPLLSDENEMFFDVDRILLFALCDPSAYVGMRNKGLKHVQQRESARIRAAKVDRTQFVDDVEQFTSLFAHRDQARGRCDFVAMDDESMGYYVRGKPPSTRTVILSPSSDSSLGPRETEESPQKQHDDEGLEK